MTATLIGATGLIGSSILELLLKDDSYSKVYLLVRKPLEIAHPKVEIILIDFNNQEQYRAAMPACDVVFSAIGTTMKKVKGNKDIYRTIDYDIPVHAAKYGKEKGCQTFLIVSALGADSKSSNFYLKLKGEVEDDLTALHIPSLHIFRPSLLMGERKEKRFGEGLGEMIMKPISFLLPAKMKPIEAHDVAKAMIATSKLDKKGTFTYYYSEMQELIK